MLFRSGQRLYCYDLSIGIKEGNFYRMISQCLMKFVDVPLFDQKGFFPISKVYCFWQQVVVASFLDPVVSPLSHVNISLFLDALKKVSEFSVTALELMEIVLHRLSKFLLSHYRKEAFESRSTL